MSPQGWHFESTRHALSSHGIPTKFSQNQLVKKEFELSRIGFRMPTDEYEEVFDEITKTLKNLKIYVNTKKVGDRYVFEFYEPRGSTKHSRAKVVGNEVHIKVTSGNDFDKLIDAVRMFQVAGYHFMVDWDRDEFEMIWNFDKFYTEDEWKSRFEPLPKDLGTESSRKLKKMMEEKI